MIDFLPGKKKKKKIYDLLVIKMYPMKMKPFKLRNLGIAILVDLSIGIFLEVRAFVIFTIFACNLRKF